MFNCTFSLDTKRQKKGGNVFYVPEIGVNADSNLQLSEDRYGNIESVSRVY